MICQKTDGTEKKWRKQGRKRSWVFFSETALVILCPYAGISPVLNMEVFGQNRKICDPLDFFNHLNEWCLKRIQRRKGKIDKFGVCGLGWHQRANSKKGRLAEGYISYVPKIYVPL